MITVTRPVHFRRGRAGRKQIARTPNPTETLPAGRVPRIAKLMALAIRFDGLLREGTVRDQSELAQLAQVTQPRMTQILNLLHLAPDIQEELLLLSSVAEGKDTVHEKMLRPICAEINWGQQREMWRSRRASKLRLQDQRSGAFRHRPLGDPNGLTAPWWKP